MKYQSSEIGCRLRPKANLRDIDKRIKKKKQLQTGSRKIDNIFEDKERKIYSNVNYKNTYTKSKSKSRAEIRNHFQKDSTQHVM